MIINQIINKNNILTDSNLPDSAVLTQKLVNVLYSNYEIKGAEFTIHIKELCKQLDISNQSRNHSRIKDSLKILKQPITEYKLAIQAVRALLVTSVNGQQKVQELLRSGEPVVQQIVHHALDKRL